MSSDSLVSLIAGSDSVNQALKEYNESPENIANGLQGLFFEGKPQSEEINSVEYFRKFRFVSKNENK